MKRLKKIGLALVVAASVSTSAFAQVRYVDVPENHWAYYAVQNVTEKQWMWGDTQQQFKPNNTVDYFLFSQIAAKIAGYKDPFIDSNVTQEEKQVAEAASQTYQSVLTRYTTRFTKWDAKSNKEIAYLLYKGILKEEDLAKFVVAQDQGGESILSLRREDMAIFVVRLMGKESEALEKTGSTGFQDDSLISVSAKPYVSYLAEAGIIQGGSNLKFNPKDKVTKAVLAKVLSDGYAPASGEKSDSAPNTSTEEGKEVYIQGTIKRFYSNLYYILLEYGDNEQRHYYIKKDATILIGNKETNIETIKEGHKVLVELVKEEGQERISKITILDHLIEEDPNVPEDVVEPSGTTTTPNTSIPKGESGVEEIPASTKRIDGVVDFMSAGGKIDIVVKYVDYKGDIKEEVETYTVSSGAVITKDSKEISVSDIKRGDIIISEVKGNILYKAAIMEKQREVEGYLAEKKRENGINILVLENNKGEETQYQILTDTMITKKGIDDTVWNDLRIGDKITLDLEYDKVVGLYAEGSSSRVEGVIEEIIISSTQSKITLKSDRGTLKTYPLLYGASIKSRMGNGSMTIYDVRLGQQVELDLDSLEIEQMVVRNQTEVSVLQGYIDNINLSDNYLDLRTTSGISKRVRVEKEVEVFKEKRRLSRKDLAEDMLIVITLQSYGSDQANIINILSD